MADPQQVRFPQFIRRLFSLKDPYRPSVENTFMPTCEVTYPLDPAAFHLRGETLVSAFGVQAAVAAQNSQTIIQAVYTDVDKYIFTIEWLLLSCGAPEQISVRAEGGGSLLASAAGSVSFSDFRDFNVPAPAVGAVPRPPAVNVVNQTTAAPSTAPIIMVAEIDIASKTYVFPVKIVVWAGMRLFIQSESVNITHRVTAMGYTRLVEPSEKF